MNIIKSHDWGYLANTIRNEDSNTVNYIMDFLTEETLRYENGEASYPRIDFAIAIALDRKNEERKNEERKNEERKNEERKNEERKNKLLAHKENVKELIIEPTTPELSPKSRRELMRNSWIEKFEREDKAKAEANQILLTQIFKQEQEQEPEQESTTNPVIRKQIVRRRIIKKIKPKQEQEPEPEQEQEPEPEPEPKAKGKPKVKSKSKKIIL